MSWTFFYNINNLPGKCEKLCEITVLNFVCKILQRMDVECRHLWLWKIKGLLLRQVYAVSIQHVHHIKIWRKNSERHKEYQNKMRKKKMLQETGSYLKEKVIARVSIYSFPKIFTEKFYFYIRKGDSSSYLL